MSQVDHLFRLTVEQFERVDVVVHCASVLGPLEKLVMPTRVLGLGILKGNFKSNPKYFKINPKKNSSGNRPRYGPAIQFLITHTNNNLILACTTIAPPSPPSPPLLKLFPPLSFITSSLYPPPPKPLSTRQTHRFPSPQLVE
jgi:hypothetical protein